MKLIVQAFVVFLAVIACFAAGLVMAAGSFLGPDEAGAAEEEGDGGPPAKLGGIPDVVLNAYDQAAKRARQVRPNCKNIRWSIPAGIGSIEAGIGKLANGKPTLGMLKTHHVDSKGNIKPPIIGARLDGSGAGGNTSAIRDHDGGKWDHDTEYDRAVGPMQFIPQTWQNMGMDGNNDGQADPNNIFDAALSTAVYLCGDKGTHTDLKNKSDLDHAIMRYNHSASYVADVEKQITYFDSVSLSSLSATGAAKDMLARAKKWSDAHVPYSQATYRDNYRTDCSGYISMIWGLKSSLTTVSLPTVSKRISKSQLATGDILLNTNAGNAGHVALFEKWADKKHTKYWGYEEAGGSGAVHRVIDYPYYPGHGTFLPYRKK